MPKPVIIEMGPFEGLHSALATRYIPPSQASASSGVDYTNGALRPIYAAGASLTTLATDARWVHIPDVAGPVYLDNKNFTCQDGAAVMTSGALTSISYYTQNTVGGGVSTPLMYAGPSNWQAAALGKATPSAPTATAGAGGIRSYRITKFKKHTTAGFIMESNPSAALTVAAGTNTLAWTAAGTAGTDVDWGTRVYATLDGISTGPYYLIYEGNAASTGVLDAHLANDTTVPLNWDAGGNPANTLYPFDHSVPLAMYVLADKLLGVPAVPAGSGNRTYSGRPRGGILFGAYYNRLYWSATGYPWYWPTLNAEDLDDVIEAIIVGQTAAYVLTRSGVYAVTGTNDTDLDIRKTNAVHGCIAEGGSAACMTPHGVVYPGVDGIILFDGDNSRNLTADSLGTDYTTSSIAGYSGGYDKGAYTLANANFQGYILDMRNWPKVNVTNLPATLATSTTGIIAMCNVRTYASAATYPPGLYLVDQLGKLRRWDPFASSFSSRLTTAAHTSGGMTASRAKPQRFLRFFCQAADTNMSFTFTCYLGGTLVATVTLAGAKEGWLPSTFFGDVLFCQITSTANTAILYGMRIEAEAND